jgi:hypothetical protein
MLKRAADTESVEDIRQTYTLNGVGRKVDRLADRFYLLEKRLFLYGGILAGAVAGNGVIEEVFKSIMGA